MMPTGFEPHWPNGAQKRASQREGGESYKIGGASGSATTDAESCSYLQFA